MVGVCQMVIEKISLPSYKPPLFDGDQIPLVSKEKMVSYFLESPWWRLFKNIWHSPLVWQLKFFGCCNLGNQIFLSQQGWVTWKNLVVVPCGDRNFFQLPQGTWLNFFSFHIVHNQILLDATRFTMTEVGLISIAHKLASGNLKVFLT